MSEQVTLKVAKRDEKGKGPNRQLRAEGIVPGVFYSKESNIPVKMALLPLEKAFRKVGTSHLMTLEIEGEEPVPVIIKEMIRHPYKNRIDHVDFYGVNMKKTVRIQVKIVTTGKPEGIDKGGVLTIFRDSIEIECLPSDIPQEISLDVTALDVNDHINIEDIEMPKGATAIFDENFAVVGVAAKAEEASEDGEEAADEPVAEETTE
ncbi:50S ribosomal protein L25 [Desulfovibrio ferrophilus]|uniref:Large ribosomal subunit protein bL25 n=1 Tax=Desulfovibrio ferrophilus TaxID=241368 RepID=A0A2Z6AW43_9BACT|nr:50S ribosomal protein L25 [Desulfovibrio ferrophilus]BBD07448.1 50S ribosomal protein L25 [Desulfovibrio ferrophilus]